MYNRLGTVPACDGRTDGQTSFHGIVCAMHMRRAVKIIKFKGSQLWNELHILN